MSQVLGEAAWAISGDLSGLQAALQQAHSDVVGATKRIKPELDNVMKGVGAMGAAITGAMGVSGYAAMGFGAKLAEIATLGVQDLAAIEAAVKSVSREFGQDLVVAADAAYAALSAGTEEAHIPYILEQAAMAATAGVSDLATAVALGSSVVNAFGLEVEEIEGAFDGAFVAVKGGVTTFDELSASLGGVAGNMASAGFSTDEMYGAVAALTKGGISTSQAVTQLSRVLEGIVSPTDGVRKAAAEMGISFDLATARTMGLNNFLKMLHQATGGSIEKISQLFTTVNGMNGALALGGNQAASYTELLNEMTSSTGQANEAFQILIQNDPSFAWRQLRSELQVLTVEVGQALLPTLKELVETILPMAKDLGDWINNNEELLQTFVPLIAKVGALMTALSGLYFIGKAVIGFAASLKAIFMALGTGIAVITSPIWGTVAAIAAVAAVIGVAVAAIYVYWDELVESCNSLWNSIVGIFEWGWEKIQAIFGWIADAASSVAGYLGFGGGDIQMRAEGGPVQAGKPYIVGERGPELFVPQSAGNITPNGGSGGIGGDLHIEFSGPMNVRDDQDVQDLSRRLASDIQSEMGYAL